MSSKPVILVTTATSHNGSEAAKLLLQAAEGEYTVRLGSRSPSKVDSSLTSRGGEPVLLDNTLESAVAAFAGVDIAYIIIPSIGDRAQRALFQNYLQAAKESNIKHIVYLSGLTAVAAELPSTSKLLSHRDNEQALRESGISYTALRGAWFHENATTWLAPSIKNTGQFRSSAGDGVWTSVAVADIAAVAVAVITHPEKHANKVYLLEEEVITESLLAEKITKAIGKKVTYVNLTPEEHRKLIKSFHPGNEAEADETADVLVELDTLKRNGTFSHVGPDLEHVLGRKGITLDEFLAQHKDAFL
jgi:NAD(P)H dehydrogenase (quinone)